MKNKIDWVQLYFKIKIITMIVRWCISIPLLIFFWNYVETLIRKLSLMYL